MKLKRLPSGSLLYVKKAKIVLRRSDKTMRSDSTQFFEKISQKDGKMHYLQFVYNFWGENGVFCSYTSFER